MRDSTMTIKANLVAVLVCMLLLAALLLSGCSSLSFGGNKAETTDIHKGTAGLEVEFLKEAPPSKMQSPAVGETALFQLGIGISNKGAADISRAYVSFDTGPLVKFIKWNEEAGSSVTQIGASGNRISISLEGKSELYPEGKTTMAFADAELLSIDPGKKSETAEVTAHLCYEYRTFAATEVCMDPDIYNQKNIRKSCTVRDVSLSGGQGAPVAVTGIKEEMKYDEEIMLPELTVSVKNAGSGTVFMSDNVEDACGPAGTIGINTITIVDVDVAGMSKSSGKLKCPETLNLKDNVGEFKCILKKENLNAYERDELLTIDQGTWPATMKIELGYGYRRMQSRRITIEKQ